MLKCPICNEKLIKEDKMFRCIHNHCFDIAKQGYVNLARKQTKNHGDNALMVKARTAFLEKDYYAFMRDFVCEKLNGDVFLDVGCGQGYYTKVFQQYFKDSFGMDISKDAIMYAAKQDKHTQYFVGSLFHLPFYDKTMDCVTSIFVPLGNEEIHRVLKDQGRWIVVGPGPRHCWQLKEVLYDVPYENEMPKLEENFVCVSQDIISETKVVDDVWSLLEMTPYRYKSSKIALERVKELERLEVTFEFVVTVYQK